MFGAPPCIIELSNISNMHRNMIAMFVKASTLGWRLSIYLGISSSTNWESSGIHIHMCISICILCIKKKYIYIYIYNQHYDIELRKWASLWYHGICILVPDNSKGESLGYTLDNSFGRSHCKQRDSLLGVNYMTTCKLWGASGNIGEYWWYHGDFFGEISDTNRYNWLYGWHRLTALSECQHT